VFNIRTPRGFVQGSLHNLTKLPTPKWRLLK